MMNTTHFDYNPTTPTFYNSVQAEAHQAYSRFAAQHQQSLSQLMPGTTYQASNLRSGQGGIQSDGTNYDACKLSYDSSSTQAFKTEAFKDQCGLKADQNGFKAPDQMSQMTSNWATSLRPSPSSTAAMSAEMRTNFDAVAACSRAAMSDAWSATNCCNSTTMTGATVSQHNFYPWMAIAGNYLLHFLSLFLLSSVVYT